MFYLETEIIFCTLAFLYLFNYGQSWLIVGMVEI